MYRLELGLVDVHRMGVAGGVDVPLHLPLPHPGPQRYPVVEGDPATRSPPYHRPSNPPPARSLGAVSPGNWIAISPSGSSMTSCR